jgi:hypothetical protein
MPGAEVPPKRASAVSFRFRRIGCNGFAVKRAAEFERIAEAHVPRQVARAVKRRAGIGLRAQVAFVAGLQDIKLLLIALQVYQLAVQLALEGLPASLP